MSLVPDVRFNQTHVAITFRLEYYYVFSVALTVLLCALVTGEYNCEISYTLLGTIVTTAAWLLQKLESKLLRD